MDSVANFVVDWGFSWSVVFTGLVVVFAILILLVLLCTLMGKAFESKDKRKSLKDSNSQSSTSSVNSKTNVQGGTAVVKMVQDGISEEVVAAITAAVSVIMSEDGIKRPFAVKSIKRSRDTRSAWNVAGIQDNTRPF